MAIVHEQIFTTPSLGRVRFGFDGDGCLVGVKLRAEGRAGVRGKAPKGVPTRLQLERWLAAYLKGRAGDFPGRWTLPGRTDFTRSVYRAVAAIPAGRTMSYGEVAAKVKAPKAYRAVGTAMGRNPIPLVVP